MLYIKNGGWEQTFTFSLYVDIGKIYKRFLKYLFGEKQLIWSHKQTFIMYFIYIFVLIDISM